MTKREIMLHIADKLEITQAITQKVIQETLDYLIESLANGKTIELRNFGVFKVKKRKAKIGRNPRTGEEVVLPSRKYVIFKSGKIMKEKIK